MKEKPSPGVRFLGKVFVAPVAKALTLVLDKLDPEGWYAAHGYKEFARLLGGGGPTDAGIIVNADSALKHSVVWACVRAISETQASLPLALMQKTGETRRHAVEHPLYRIVHDEPNADMSDFDLRETMDGHALVIGNAYSRVIRRSGSSEILGLNAPFDPRLVTPKRTPQGSRYYEWNHDGTTDQINPSEILHIHGLGFDGLQGYSVVAYARNSFGLGQVQDRYAARFFARGGRRPYLLKHPTRFKTDPEFDAFKAKWNAAYGNVEEMHQAPLLEGGVEYQELGFSQQDVQFIESRTFSVSDICRWFRISPHLVQDLSRATFSNIEHLAIEFVQHTLMPWCVRWEKALNRTLLTDKEKQDGYYFKHNMNALLRGDFASRMQGYSTAVQNGLFNRNECREWEDLNPFDGGEDYTIQLNMQPLPVSEGGQASSAQSAALIKVGSRQRGG